ncbi:MAG: hypothetical protein V1787_00635 [Candidatus Micrarchaeota archaeon]
MTVKGDELVYNCRNCYCTYGYGINLKPSGNAYSCPQCSTRYIAQQGYMVRA